MAEFIRYTRDPWEADFPDVFVHAALESRDLHPDYPAAKAGDLASAQRLVEALLNEQTLQELAAFVGDRQVLLAGISALESVVSANDPRSGRTLTLQFGHQHAEDCSYDLHAHWPPIP